MLRCINCYHYRAMFNLGYWWCALQHDDMDADHCKDYDEMKYTITTTEDSH